MSFRHKAGTIAGSMAVLSLAFTGLSGIANAQTQSFNQKVAGDAVTFVGKVPYVYGGSSPSTGFDCSGLTSYVYGLYGKSIPRTAETVTISTGQMQAKVTTSTSMRMPKP